MTIKGVMQAQQDGDGDGDFMIDGKSFPQTSPIQLVARVRTKDERSNRTDFTVEDCTGMPILNGRKV